MSAYFFALFAFMMPSFYECGQDFCGPTYHIDETGAIVPNVDFNPGTIIVDPFNYNGKFTPKPGGVEE